MTKTVNKFLRRVGGSKQSTLPAFLKSEMCNVMQHNANNNKNVECLLENPVIQSFTDWVHKNIPIFQILERLDVQCIIHRELHIFHICVLNNIPQIVRLDGPSGRMVHMCTLLWTIFNKPVPKQICVDIDESTVAYHRKNPEVHQAYHQDLYDFLLNVFQSKGYVKTLVYADFCHLPKSSNTIYNSEMLSKVINKNPHCNFIISHSTMGWKGCGKDKSRSWDIRLKQHSLKCVSPIHLQKNLFRTSHIVHTGQQKDEKRILQLNTKSLGRTSVKQMCVKRKISKRKSRRIRSFQTRKEMKANIIDGRRRRTSYPTRFT